MSVNTWEAVNVWGGGTVFELAPQVVNTLSESLNPSISFSSAFNLSPSVVNSLSVAINPALSFGNIQKIGTVTATFGKDLYTVKFAD